MLKSQLNLFSFDRLLIHFSKKRVIYHVVMDSLQQVRMIRVGSDLFEFNTFNLKAEFNLMASYHFMLEFN